MSRSNGSNLTQRSGSQLRDAAGELVEGGGIGDSLMESHGHAYGVDEGL